MRRCTFCGLPGDVKIFTDEQEKLGEGKRVPAHATCVRARILPIAAAAVAAATTDELVAKLVAGE